MLSREKVIHNNLNKYIYILKIDSPKNISLNIRNVNYRAGNIRHSYRPIATILDHTRLHKNIGNNNIAVSLAYVVGPMAWPGACAPGLGLKYEIVLQAGPGLDIIVAGRTGPGPHNSICGPGLGQVSTTAACPGRALASNHVCGPGLGLDFRPVQGPTT